ncbi:hypothetical protein NEOLEDRAFT_989551 [Neolentinus lepideus HHB14362 ss-1]|uniref:Uncharacterized protein n=1 Tax=Neolentinus lepideus HHB14362 ss-1 TaxID=1314782 RepID=A0A165N4G9_9AGAM|nr:hypothetical protein NEOLEDRAFT_989551 [Neolentinus lepideus HHB14362 ss-1]
MAGLIAALSSAVVSLFISDPQSSGNYSPSRDDILQVRTVLLHHLPIELVDAILHLAEYYSCVRAEQDAEMVFKSNSYCYVQTPPVSGLVKRVEIVIESHDQGWSSYPENWGSYDNSWTWFRGVIRRQDGSSGGTWDIARNIHAHQKWQIHTIVWEKPEDHPLMRELRMGDMIEIWPEARYPGWVNYVRHASVKIFCWI